MPVVGRSNTIGAVPTVEDVVPAASIMVKSRVLNGISYAVLADADGDVNCGDECCIFILPVQTINEGRKLALLRKILDDEAVCLDSKGRRIWRLHIDAVTVLTKMSQLGYIVAGVAVEGLGGESVHTWTLTAFDHKVVMYDNECSNGDGSNENARSESEMIANIVMSDDSYTYLAESMKANGEQRGETCGEAVLKAAQKSYVKCEPDDYSISLASGVADVNHKTSISPSSQVVGVAHGSAADESFVLQSRFDDHASGQWTNCKRRKRKEDCEALAAQLEPDERFINDVCISEDKRMLQPNIFQYTDNDVGSEHVVTNTKRDKYDSKSSSSIASSPVDDLLLAGEDLNEIVIDGCDVVIGSMPFTRRLPLVRVDELVSNYLPDGHWITFIKHLLDAVLHGHERCWYLTESDSKGCGNVLPSAFTRSVYSLLAKAWYDVRGESQIKRRCPNANDFCQAVTEYFTTRRAHCTLHYKK